MWSVGASLGRSFLVAGFLPTIVFILALDYVVAPLLYGGQSLLNRSYQGIEDLNYLLVAVVVSFLLLALNQPLISFYSQGPFFLRRLLLRRNLERHRETFTALHARQEAFRQASENLVGLVEAIGRLEATYEALEKRGNWRNLPAESQLVKPTELGNILTRMESYPYEHYGMDSSQFWPRLTAVIPEEYKDQIGDLKTTLDFMLNTSFLAGVFGTVSLVLGAWQSIFATNEDQGEFAVTAILLGLVALVSSYAFYRIGVGVARVFGKNITSCFDLFRWKLLEDFGIDRPDSLIAERQLWQALADFIRRAELFYYPTTTTNEDEVASLQQAIVHHAYYLHRLRLLLDSEIIPEFLEAQISITKKQIADMEKELSTTD
jgi:hypothetical protein